MVEDDTEESSGGKHRIDLAKRTILNALAMVSK